MLENCHLVKSYGLKECFSKPVFSNTHSKTNRIYKKKHTCWGKIFRNFSRQRLPTSSSDLSFIYSTASPVMKDIRVGHMLCKQNSSKTFTCLCLYALLTT